MSLDRNAVYDALFVLLAGAANFKTTGRRLKFWSDVAEQPALFLRSGDDEYDKRPVRGLPAMVVLDAEVWIYYNTKNPDEAPGIMLDTLIQAVETAIEPPNVMVQTQTLGGIVSHCWFEGKIIKDDGAISGQAVAMIPIKILTTSKGFVNV